MVEVSSRWILQEIFTDPSACKEVKDGELFLKVASEVEKKGEGLIEVVVEFSGSVIEEKFQLANFRFVNVSQVKAPLRRKKSAVKKVEERRKQELLTFLPVYLLRAGITLRKVEVEL